MCYTCGSVDHPLPSRFIIYRFKGHFRNFAFFLFPQAAWYRYSRIHKFVDMSVLYEQCFVQLRWFKTNE